MEEDITDPRDEGKYDDLFIVLELIKKVMGGFDIRYSVDCADQKISMRGEKGEVHIFLESGKILVYPLVYWSHSWHSTGGWGFPEFRALDGTELNLAEPDCEFWMGQYFCRILQDKARVYAEGNRTRSGWDSAQLRRTFRSGSAR